MNALQLLRWLQSMPEETLAAANVCGTVFGRPHSAKRAIHYRFKDGSGSGIVINPMGTHLSDEFYAAVNWTEFTGRY